MYCLVVTDDFSRFSWVFFLASKDGTSEILKTFITGIENLIDLRVKVIRCDNGTEFKNRVMNQFCEMKGFKREFSVARTPQQNRNSKDSPDAGFKPLGEEEKKDAEDPRNESGNPTEGKDSEVPSTKEPRINQEKDDSINSTNNINTASDGNSTNNVNAVSLTVNAAGSEVNVVDPKTSIELPNDPNMPELEDIVYSDDDEDVGAGADMNNLDAFMPVSPIPTTRIHKDHQVDQIIGDLNSTPQARRMTKNLKEHVYRNKKDEIDDSRSQSGWIFLLNEGAMTWKSSKQDIVAYSTCEPEYIAACKASKEAIWMKIFIRDLGVVPTVQDPIKILCDNVSVVALTKEPKDHRKSKHIERKYHFV
ncbi:putative ribonuclease H-like domain-containing protein [Tanacetum coccineum]